MLILIIIITTLAIKSTLIIIYIAIYPLPMINHLKVMEKTSIIDHRS